MGPHPIMSASEIKSAIKEQNQAFQDANSLRATTLNEGIAAEIVAQKEKLASTELLLSEEIGKGGEASAEKIQQLQTELNSATSFLEKHANDRAALSSEIAEIERFNGLDAIEKLKEKFALEQTEANIAHANSIATLKNKLKEENKARQKAIKKARKIFKTQFKLIRKDARSLVKDIAKEFGGLPDEILKQLSELKSKFSKTGTPLSVPGFAKGVNNFGGGLAVVGEEGPELVSLPRGSSVSSNRDSQSILNQNKDITVNIFEAEGRSNWQDQLEVRLRSI